MILVELREITVWGLSGKTKGTGLVMHAYFYARTLSVLANAVPTSPILSVRVPSVFRTFSLY
jgi:hypothetical protein